MRPRSSATSAAPVMIQRERIIAVLIRAMTRQKTRLSSALVKKLMRWAPSATRRYNNPLGGSSGMADGGVWNGGVPRYRNVESIGGVTGATTRMASTGRSAIALKTTAMVPTRSRQEFPR